MGEGKEICCAIMLCQMTAILSGVAMLYLAVIVVIPARDELAAGFHPEPIMCTTVYAQDIAVQGKKVDCDWSTCGEWCLSKSSTPCMQIFVMARDNGSAVKFYDCFDIEDKPCSALNVELTSIRNCKLGECKEITGLYNCSKNDNNPCREITSAYHCGGGTINPETIICDEEKCAERLGGVYTCTNGACNRLDHIKDYSKDCKRKCTDLRLEDINVVLFSSERLITTKCTRVHSDDNNTISELNDNQEWKKQETILFLYCTYIYKTNGERGYDLHTGDCFNATLGDAATVSPMTNFLDLLDYFHEASNESDYLIEPEETLRRMNTTKLKINQEGCVNSLIKECKAFFSTHATDGRDGKSADRFPCYYTDLDPDMVVGKFNPETTYLYLMSASIVPFCLFTFSCLCLFVCSKSVGIGDDGKLKVKFLQASTTQVVKEPVQFDELL